MMVKEHFIDTYGPVKFTIGEGGSGGAIQQYEIADSYPGIVDGIIPAISFPDPLTTGGPVTDCRLLDQFFAGAGSAFTAAQQKAIAGYNDYTTCKSWDVTFSNRATATGSCNSAIPVADRGTPPPTRTASSATPTSRSSTRWAPTQDGLPEQRPGQHRDPVRPGRAEIRGHHPGAVRPLNADIGGLDFTGAPSAARTDASLRALNAVYADDLYNGVTQGLRTTPVIDARDDLDFAGLGNDIHTTDWSFIMRPGSSSSTGPTATRSSSRTSPPPRRRRPPASTSCRRWTPG